MAESIHPCTHRPSYLPSNPSIPHDPSSTSSSFVETLLLICMTKERENKKLSWVSVHLQPTSDSNLTVCGFSRHRRETDFKANRLFWWITVNSAQVQTVKMRVRASYVTPPKLKRAGNLSCSVRHKKKKRKKKLKTFWSEKCTSVPFFSVIASACKWGSFLCLWLPESSSNASSGECNWYHPQTHERVLSHQPQIVVEYGWDYGLSLSLISFFLLAVELCSNPTVAQVQPPLLQGPEAWNRLASMWMSNSVMVRHGATWSTPTDSRQGSHAMSDIAI